LRGFSSLQLSLSTTDGRITAASGTSTAPRRHLGGIFATAAGKKLGAAMRTECDTS